MKKFNETRDFNYSSNVKSTKRSILLVSRENKRDKNTESLPYLQRSPRIDEQLAQGMNLFEVPKTHHLRSSSMKAVERLSRMATTI